jgi:DNA-binding winged helix-turn-helix (wHTH) protein
MHGAAVHRKLRFGPFDLSIGERVLRREGVVLPLGSRAFDILVYLAERAGEIIAKKELIDHVWPDVTVEEGSLRVHVAAIRKALGDGQFGNRYIANIKGRGYSFVGTVAPLAGGTEGMEIVSDLGAGLAASGLHEEALTLVVNALAAQERGEQLLNVPALMRVKGLILASRSVEDYPEAERSLLSSIEWARRQSAALFELQAAMDLAELLLKQDRLPEADQHLRAALHRMPSGIASPVHQRALQILNRLQSGLKAAS